MVLYLVRIGRFTLCDRPVWTPALVVAAAQSPATTPLRPAAKRIGRHDRNTRAGLRVFH